MDTTIVQSFILLHLTEKMITIKIYGSNLECKQKQVCSFFQIIEILTDFLKNAPTQNIQKLYAHEIVKQISRTHEIC